MDYEKMINDIMKSTKEMTLEDKEHLLALLMSAYGDLSMSVLFDREVVSHTFEDVKQYDVKKLPKPSMVGKT